MTEQKDTIAAQDVETEALRAFFKEMKEVRGLSTDEVWKMLNKAMKEIERQEAAGEDSESEEG
jgi:uncharacterized alpha-E superfamily protein